MLDTTGGGHVALRRNRDFLLLWSGQTISAVGTSVTRIAYPLLALAITGSAASAGVVGFVGLGVTALARLPSGLLADRAPLKPVLVGADLLRMAATASVVVALVADRLSLVQLVVVAVLTAVGDAAFESAQAVAVAHVVSSAQLPTAMAQSEARGHLASLTGQPVGGYLYGLNPALPFVGDAASFLASAGLIALIRTPMPRAAIGPGRESVWRALPTGLRHVWRSPFLRAALLCAAGFNLIFAGLPLLIIATQRAAGTSAGHLGLIFSFGAVGGIVGAVASGPIQRRLPPPTLVHLFGWSATLAFAALAWTHHPYVAGALLAVVFLAATPANAMLYAVQIHLTPPELQGRVISAALLTAGMAAPLGPLLAGALLDHSGGTAAFLAFAAATTALTVLTHVNTAIRTMRRPGE